MTREELNQTIRKALHERGQLTPVSGVFSDHLPSIAYIEGQRIGDKGLETKFFGCSYWSKVNADQRLHDITTATKSAYMSFAELVFEHPIIFAPAVLYFALFPKKLVDKAWRVYSDELKKHVRLHEFSPFTKELVRAGHAIADRIPIKGDDKFHPEEYRNQVKDLITCFVSFLQSTYSYLYRAQDVFFELISERAKKAPRKEVLRVFGVAISREHQIPGKLKLVRTALSFLLLIPKYRKLAAEYLGSLNREKIRPDNADCYYAFTRKGYDTWGIPYGKRIAMVRGWNEKEGNCIVVGEEDT